MKSVERKNRQRWQTSKLHICCHRGTKCRRLAGLGCCPSSKVQETLCCRGKRRPGGWEDLGQSRGRGGWEGAGGWGWLAESTTGWLEGWRPQLAMFGLADTDSLAQALHYWLRKITGKNSLNFYFSLSPEPEQKKLLFISQNHVEWENMTKFRCIFHRLVGHYSATALSFRRW